MMVTSLDSSCTNVAPYQVHVADAAGLHLCEVRVQKSSRAAASHLESSCAVCDGSCVIIPSAGNSSLSDWICCRVQALSSELHKLGVQYLVLPSLQGKLLSLNAHAEAWCRAVLAQSSDMPPFCSLAITSSRSALCHLAQGSRPMGRQLLRHIEQHCTVSSVSAS